MLVALSGFSLMAISAREVSASLQTYHILFFRSLFALIIISFFFTIKGWSHLSVTNFKLHFSRDFSHFIGQYGWFYGIAFLPLAEVFALEFTVPFWTAIAAYFILKEKINSYKILAIIFGITGVVIILKPGLSIIQPAAIAVLIGAASFGITHVITRKLTLTTNILSILFYMSLIQMLLAGVPTIYNWVSLSNTALFYVALIAITGLLAHYAMSKALSFSDATIVIPMDFLRLPLIIFLGYLLYQETVDSFLIIGALIMLAGNMINVFFNAKAQTS